LVLAREDSVTRSPFRPWAGPQKDRLQGVRRRHAASLQPVGRRLVCMRERTTRQRGEGAASHLSIKAS
jgi:hypothetical protein